MLAAAFGAGQVAFSFLWFFLFLIEIWLMISVFVDIFRSHDLRGWAKAAWIVFILVVPLIGILAYLIVRGDQMRAHQLHPYTGTRARGPSRGAPESVIEGLTRLAELRDRGDITSEEYRRLKDALIDPDQPDGT